MCGLNYNIDSYKGVFRLETNGWTKLTQSVTPEAEVLDFSQKDIELIRNRAAIKETQNGVPVIAKTDNGIQILVPGNCSSLSGKKKSEISNLIKDTVNEKIKAGEIKIGDIYQ